MAPRSIVQLEDDQKFKLMKVSSYYQLQASQTFSFTFFFGSFTYDDLLKNLRHRFLFTHIDS